MSGEILCIIPGPTKRVREGDDGVRWCFGCRKRLPHKWVLFDYPEPSYYEPIVVRECSGCGKDRTAFGS